MNGCVYIRLFVTTSTKKTGPDKKERLNETGLLSCSGLYSYGLNSYGLNSYGLNSYGLYGYGLYSNGLGLLSCSTGLLAQHACF